MKDILNLAKQIHFFAGRILYMNLLGTVFVSFLDGLGTLLLIPMLGMSGIVNVNVGSIPFAGELTFLQDLPRTIGLSLILGIYALLMIGQSLLQRNLAIRDIRIHTGFVNHVRLASYRAILQANWDFFIRRRKSDLINILTAELGRVGSGLRLLMQFGASVMFTAIQIGIAFWLSAKLTLLVLGCGLVLGLFSRKFIKRSKALGDQTSDLAQSYLAGITDHFNGIKDIKSNMLEGSRYSWLSEWCRMIEQERIANFKLRSNSQLFFKISAAVLITCFLFASVVLFQVRVEQLLLVVVIFSRLWPRFSGIQSNLEEIASCIPSFRNWNELQRECREAGELKEISSAEAVQPVRLKMGIECRSVSFKYNPREEVYALQDVTVQIPTNRMTAIVGRSGAGKSTLVDVLMGLMEPARGQVLIDGTPLASENVLAFRRSISYVPQDPFLFHASIRENLLMVQPNASEAQIWEALEFSAAAEFVKRLPLGLDTLIGDRGIRLSGGERQRLVLARAILRKPAILVLDEATSALDTENEARIQEALEKLKGTMTIIVIAHRLSTIRNADQVIVLDKGSIIQRGAYSHLAKEKGGLFSTFLGNQVPDAKVIAAT